MDDLLGEDWQQPATTHAAPPRPPLTPATVAPASSSLRARPALPTWNPARPTSHPALPPSGPALPPSGPAAPQTLSRPSSTLNAAAKPARSDAFGSLRSPSPKAAASAISLQERQKQLLEEKRRQHEQQAAMWDALGSGRATPHLRGPPPASHGPPPEAEDDILAAFHKDAPVDTASHFPPPLSAPASACSPPAVPPAPYAAPTASNSFHDDDDPFGLASLPTHTDRHATPLSSHHDHDILGDLGKPVTETPATHEPASAAPQPEPQERTSAGDEPGDRALAELVDMGFPLDHARVALAESGGDAQTAVGWLLQQAHEESKQKARAAAGGRGQSPGSAARRQDSRSPAGGETDAAQVAHEYGAKFFKGASSLWKASQKQMAKTVAEFQQERDPSQPKWMQEAASVSRPSRQRRPPETPAPRTAAPAVDVTDEAAMLDAPRERRQKPARSARAEGPTLPSDTDRSPAQPLPRRPAQPPRFVQQAPPAQDKRPSKLSRQDVEDQSAQAYISPARRKKQPPIPEPQPEPEGEARSSPASAPRERPAVRPTPSPTPARAKPPPRTIPAVSSIALSTSANHRRAGGEAFKRGDYASAHEAYGAALNLLPATHPISIIVLSNRSLTALKTGDAKMAVSDADRALEVIGAGQGVGETIDLGGGEGSKSMREFYGKALMRKAEALEHMEKWSDAAGVWRSAVEAGVGGAVSLRGRDRCEKAAAPRPATKSAGLAPAPHAPTHVPPAQGLGNSSPRHAVSTAKSAEAVQKLRAANAAAEKAEDEKFALTDGVEARLTAWKGGKADNLRALLQSLDTVLWGSAGWKKVGMSDLVLPHKVKMVYMKAIAKVHPDKIAHGATTEQRMISAAVFSTLNEAWDKFKQDHHL